VAPHNPVSSPETTTARPCTTPDTPALARAAEYGSLKPAGDSDSARSADQPFGPAIRSRGGFGHLIRHILKVQAGNPNQRVVLMQIAELCDGVELRHGIMAEGPHIIWTRERVRSKGIVGTLKGYDRAFIAARCELGATATKNALRALRERGLVVSQQLSKGGRFAWGVDLRAVFDIGRIDCFKGANDVRAARRGQRIRAAERKRTKRNEASLKDGFSDKSPADNSVHSNALLRNNSADVSVREVGRSDPERHRTPGSPDGPTGVRTETPVSDWAGASCGPRSGSAQTPPSGPAEGPPYVYGRYEDGETYTTDRAAQRAYVGTAPAAPALEEHIDASTPIAGSASPPVSKLSGVDGHGSEVSLLDLTDERHLEYLWLFCAGQHGFRLPAPDELEDLAQVAPDPGDSGATLCFVSRLHQAAGRGGQCSKFLLMQAITDVLQPEMLARPIRD
jgi:hypothetical protein